MKFNEFLNEASIAEVKAKAFMGVLSGKYKYENTEESRYQFARDMKAEGFTGNVVSNAWKSAVVTGELFRASKSTPKPKAEAPTKKAEKPKATVDKAAVKTILSNYEKINKLLDEIAVAGRKIEKDFKSANAGVKIHNLETPELYKQSVAVANAHYISDLRKMIDDRIWSIKQIK